MNGVELKVKINCKYHPQTLSKYLYISKEKQKLIPVCSVCTKIQGLNFDSLILNEECLSLNENNIITNWPPLEDQNLEIKFFQYLMESQQSQNMAEAKQKCILKFKDEVLSLINRIEKTDFLFNNEEIQRVYNYISEKNKLKLFVTNQISKKEMKSYMRNILSNTSNNKSAVQSIIKKYDAFYKIGSVNTYESIFNSIITQLESFQQLISSNQTQYQPQQVFQMIDEAEKNKTDSIKQIINLYNLTQIQLLENIQTTQQFNQNKINLLTKQINQIQDEQSTQIMDQLESKIKGLDFNNLLKPKQISLYQNELYYFDYPITQDDFNRSLQMKILQLKDWIVVGILNMTDIASQKQKFYPQIDQNLYFYMISSNGYSWNQEDISQNQVKNSFEFSESDVINIKVEQNYITFNKQNSDDTFIMKFSFNQNKKYYLCFLRTNDISSIELIV